MLNKIAPGMVIPGMAIPCRGALLLKNGDRPLRLNEQYWNYAGENLIKLAKYCSLKASGGGTPV
ncbi:hypothetical protein OKW21_004649 [Catalinimonas alkaloidigena]|uniref:hypothetical protein n=1 Tax=Catalinimonas alkaloidigena TaxID=1075417 RepID=UPI002405F744|nr:hypothetical protein [Catalinimonas alkaloidigena]MDF9799386.1 hypothetical protein [Catalinimonas alkaloidigena]